MTQSKRFLLLTAKMINEWEDDTTERKCNAPSKAIMYKQDERCEGKKNGDKQVAYRGHI